MEEEEEEESEKKKGRGEEKQQDQEQERTCLSSHVGVELRGIRWMEKDEGKQDRWRRRRTEEKKEHV